MTTNRYSSELQLHAARDEYFQRNAFGADGGYSAAWVDFKLGPIPFPFPNTPARVRAVCFHDLHHVLTEYSTDFLGELEISAWEIGAGCKRNFFAWQINLGGLGGGMLLAPRRTAAAFYRGLQSNTLYGEDYAELLEQGVGPVRERLGLTATVAPTLAASLRLALATIAGLGFGVLQFAFLLPLVPLGLWFNVQRARARAVSV
jgi:hypothetical protein